MSLIKKNHSWIVCRICDFPIKDTKGGICKCGNLRVTKEEETGAIFTEVEEGDKVVYDTD